MTTSLANWHFFSISKFPINRAKRFVCLLFALDAYNMPKMIILIRNFNLHETEPKRKHKNERNAQVKSVRCTWYKHTGTLNSIDVIVITIMIYQLYVCVHCGKYESSLSCAFVRTIACNALCCGSSHHKNTMLVQNGVAFLK